MSADSSKRQTKHGITGQVVLPQPVNDPSIIDSVAGFIHEVVPQAYTSVLNTTGGETSKESIVWAKFLSSDYNDPENFLADTECQSDSVPPLLLALGYGAGVQVWGVSGGGEGRELVSWPQGSVRALQLLGSPPPGARDPLATKRPLVAVVDNTGPGAQFHTLNFISLRTADNIKSIKFKTAICELLSNKKSLVVTFPEKIAIFDICTLEDRLTVTTCFPSPGINPNPVALGPRWLAYCDKKLTTWQRSSGGCEDEGVQSYTATVIHAAKSLGKGLRDLSGSLTGTTAQVSGSTSQPGVVTIIDIEAAKGVKQAIEEETSPGNMIAHFIGHTGPIVAMVFDPSGMLLVMGDKHGHRFNVFRIHPHPCGSSLAAAHHLYILHRGETTARVQDMCVSWDSRWVAVSSLRGTTHVFPISPYGGSLAVRTHTTPHVVNRLSRFERSAGLSDGRGSPEGTVPGGNPRLPPYPQPTVVNPLAQIRRCPAQDQDMPPPSLRLAAKFAPPRAFLPPRATPPRTPRHSVKPRVADSLFIISSYGSLVQYDLEPRSISTIPKDKISYDTGIELCVEAKGEWVLLRPPCLGSIQPPLPQGNPLLPPGLPASIRTPLVVSPQLHHPAKGSDDRWLSQVEIITHTGPHRRLWMGPQFTFKSLDQGSPGESEPPEADNVRARSNPVNMPRRPYLWIESSSGGSVDAPYMTDNSEDDSIHSETRLREDLAEAMLDTALHPSGGVVEGGDKAVERRVTQFGAVVAVSPIVLPEVRVSSPPDHPLPFPSHTTSKVDKSFNTSIIVETPTDSVLFSVVDKTNTVDNDNKSTGDGKLSSTDLVLGGIVDKTIPVDKVDRSTGDGKLQSTDLVLSSVVNKTITVDKSNKTTGDGKLLSKRHTKGKGKGDKLSEKFAKCSKEPFQLLEERREDCVGPIGGAGFQIDPEKEHGQTEEKFFPEQCVTALEKTKDHLTNVEIGEVSFSELDHSTKISKNELSSGNCESIVENKDTSSIDCSESSMTMKAPSCASGEESYSIRVSECAVVEASCEINKGGISNFSSKSEFKHKEDKNLISSPKSKIPSAENDGDKGDLCTKEETKVTNTKDSAKKEEMVKCEGKESGSSSSDSKDQSFTKAEKGNRRRKKRGEKKQHGEASVVTACVSEERQIKSKEEFSVNVAEIRQANEDKFVSSTDITSSLPCGSSKLDPEKDICDPLLQKCDTHSTETNIIMKSEELSIVVEQESRATDAYVSEERDLEHEISSSIAELDKSESLEIPKVENNFSKESESQLSKSFIGTASFKKENGKGRKKKKKSGETMKVLPVEPCLELKDSSETIKMFEVPKVFEIEKETLSVDVLVSSSITEVNTKEKIEKEEREATIGESEREINLLEDTDVAEIIDNVFLLETSESSSACLINEQSETELAGSHGIIELGKDVSIVEESPLIMLNSEIDIVESYIELDKSCEHGDNVLNESIEGLKEIIHLEESVTEQSVQFIETKEPETIQEELLQPFIEKRKKKRKSMKDTVVESEEIEEERKSESSSFPFSESAMEENIEVRKIKKEVRSKTKSPSPSKVELCENSESSDEATLPETKPALVKQSKRKKVWKKIDLTESIDVGKEKPKCEGTSDGDYETCSEKKSDSSVESFFESQMRREDSGADLIVWSSTVKEDRDSVYESCNDDELGLAAPILPTKDSLQTQDKPYSNPPKETLPPAQTSNKQKKQKKKKR